MNTCCFTGHRVIPAKDYAKIQKRLEVELIQLIHQGVCCFRAGGALGFDTMAARAVLDLRIKFPDIRLILVLPCREQAARWRDEDRKTYNQILRQADEVVYTSEHYHEGCMHKRNRYLVDSSEICICCLTKDSGGTAYTVDYARQKGLQIINCARSP